MALNVSNFPCSARTSCQEGEFVRCGTSYDPYFSERKPLSNNDQKDHRAAEKV